MPSPLSEKRILQARTLSGVYLIGSVGVDICEGPYDSVVQRSPARRQLKDRARLGCRKGPGEGAGRRSALIATGDLLLFPS